MRLSLTLLLLPITICYFSSHEIYCRFCKIGMVVVVYILDFVIFANALKTNRPKMMNIPRKLGGTKNSNLAKLITLW